MIPVGSFDPDRVALAEASARRDARTTDVEVLRRDAEVVLERLLARWRGDRLTAPESAHAWDDDVRDAVDALSALEAAIEQLRRGPRLVRQRTHS